MKARKLWGTRVRVAFQDTWNGLADMRVFGLEVPLLIAAFLWIGLFLLVARYAQR